MRKIFAFFVLMVFLLPILEKGIHAFEHEEEEHCAAYEETHLHEKHTDCSLCDFHLEPAAESSEATISIPFLEIKEKKYSPLTSPSSRLHFHFSLRGPPVRRLF